MYLWAKFVCLRSLSLGKIITWKIIRKDLLFQENYIFIFISDETVKYRKNGILKDGGKGVVSQI